MTNNKPNHTTCSDCHRKLNRSNCTNQSGPFVQGISFCDDCYELAGLEAAHQDGHHEDQADVDCLMCNPDARADRSRKAHGGDTTPHSRGSHTHCYAKGAHAKTREGRATCRKARAQG